MTFFKNVKQLLLLILITICCNLHSQVHEDDSGIWFMVASDPQLGFYNKNDSFSIEESRNFEKIINTANELEPAFLIICGDLVNDYTSRTQIEEYHRIINKLDPKIPFFGVAGNHDVGNIPTSESLIKYRRNFGKDYYSFEIDGIYGIVLNSSLIQNPEDTIDEYDKQFIWLLKELLNAKESNYQNIFIFQHIPWFVDDILEKDEYFNLPRKLREFYLTLFHEFGVKYIFAGHLHKNAKSQYKDIQIITTSAIGVPLGDDPPGARIVRKIQNKIIYPYYLLDCFPNNINLEILAE